MLSRSANQGRVWLALAAIGVVVGGRTRRAALRGVGALWATSLLTNAVLKPVTRRRRPALELTPAFRRLRRSPRSTSFPSGHAASAAAFATGVALESPRLGAALAPLAATVAYSRVHVGVHHVSDVVAGAALGTGIALATQRWWKVRLYESPPVRARVPAPAIDDGAGMVLVVNEQAGRDDDTADRLCERLPKADVLTVRPGVDFAPELAQRAAGARVLGAAGGDGTIAAVAAAALRRQVPLAVFPTGTLNHFARDVGIDSIEDTLAALAAGDAVTVDVAAVNGQPFLNTVVLGAYPDLVRRREQLEPRFGKQVAMAIAAGQVLRRQEPLMLRVDGEPVMVWTLFVGNGAYRGPAPAWRPRLDDGRLDLKYLRAGRRFARTRAVLSILAGLTEVDGVHEVRLAHELQVESQNGPVRFARDGEAGEPTAVFRFTKLPGHLVIYRPLP